MLAVSLELTAHCSVYLCLISLILCSCRPSQMTSIKLYTFKIISGKILFLQFSLNPRSSSGRGWDFPFQSRLVLSGTWSTSGLSWVFCNVPGRILLKEEKIIPPYPSDLASGHRCASVLILTKELFLISSPLAAAEGRSLNSLPGNDSNSSRSFKKKWGSIAWTWSPCYRLVWSCWDRGGEQPHHPGAARAAASVRLPACVWEPAMLSALHKLPLFFFPSFPGKRSVALSSWGKGIKERRGGKK